MNNSKFNYLIPEISKTLTLTFMRELNTKIEFKKEIDTAPLLNMTISVFVNSLLYILDKIKQTTNGEDKLFRNIDLTKDSLVKAISDLPFVEKVEYIK